MNVEIIASGSTGNCALIDGVIMIDAGKKIPKAKAIDVEAILLSHCHSDHIKMLCEYFGFPIYCSEHTAKKLGEKYEPHKFNIIEPDHPFVLNTVQGWYTIRPLELQHDVPCLGFDIERRGDGRILFATDFYRIKSGICLADYDALYIECNNTLSEGNMLAVFFGDDPPKDAFHRKKSYQNHCNVSYLIGLLKKQGYSKENRYEKPITLLHKSSFYYEANIERISELIEIANVINPNY